MACLGKLINRQHKKVNSPGAMESDRQPPGSCLYSHLMIDVAPRALILAAGRGERMRPLTDHTPKPLLPVQGKPLLRWWAEALVRGGVQRIAINTAWLGEQVEAHFADQPLPGAGPIHFSREGRDFGQALETAGGIVRVLPWLAPTADDVFWVVGGDVFAPGFRLDRQAAQRFAASGRLAHLWLVPNPPHHPGGDFGIDGGGLAIDEVPPGGVRHTFSTVALYRRALFESPWCDIPPGNPQGRAERLAPLLRRAMADGHVSAELYTGPWTDVGTPERLASLNQQAR